MYVTTDPKNPDAWSLVPGTDKDHLNHDASLFYDSEEDKIWHSFGCSPKEPIYVQQVDAATMLKTGPVYEVCYKNSRDHGWEDRGGDWLEGSQILKRKGVWYVIFAGYSLESSYADGVYTAAAPTGPYAYAEYSPVSNKETGYATGAGHGHLFQDLYGNWWKVTCSSVLALDYFERRINLFPAGIDSEGQMYANTALTDYPVTIPTGPRDHRKSCLKGWMLLSRKAKAGASSSEPDHAPENAFDENIKTWWNAASRNEGEWLKVDLGTTCTVHSIQANFAEDDTGEYDPSRAIIQYKVEYSNDDAHWKMMVDKWENRDDRSHDYTELPQAVKARYIRLVNRAAAFGGKFAVRDLRVFGNAGGDAPSPVDEFSIERLDDTRKASLRWNAAAGAEGYVVRYGIAANKLDLNYQLYDTAVQIVTLNKGVPYYFRIDSFNRNGYAEGALVKSVPAQ
ncbi:discoidin domain-containing protein [Candidatus Sumerlaeota bacterium]|nr:discoidin domain-containing protein [Candidatus Sumerlaeota bacterium]